MRLCERTDVFDLDGIKKH